MHQFKHLEKTAHPGLFLRELVEQAQLALACSQQEIADGLLISRKTLSAILNGRQRITVEMALKLSVAFPGVSLDFWLTRQRNYDLGQASKKVDVSKVKQLG